MSSAPKTLPQSASFLSDEFKPRWGPKSKIMKSLKPSKAKAASGVVMIWEGTVVTEEEYETATEFLMNALGLRTPPVIIGSTTTLPNPGDQSGETGGRVDFIFRICESDIPAAAVRRITKFSDMRWASDVKKSIYSSTARRMLRA